MNGIKSKKSSHFKFFLQVDARVRIQDFLQSMYVFIPIDRSEVNQL